MAEFNGIQSLPKSNIVESGYLESMLSNFSTSYKLFWFKGIYREVLGGHTEITYKHIVARMIAEAWYPVIFFNLSLGVADKLADAVWYIHETLHVSREEKVDKIVEYILVSDDKVLNKKIKSFTDFVPYRLIRPFYQREIDNERQINSKDYSDSKVNSIIEQYNKVDQNNALYILNRVEQRVKISSNWVKYLTDNAAVIEGWLNYKLINYIQQRNPSVPAIPFKIFPPVERDLKEATKYWEIVQMKLHLPDLYTDKSFTSENMSVYGNVSIDHFIPWSFDLHDEIWNLYPAFKNINSAKGNKLPDMDKYLTLFCEYQYKGFLVAKEDSKIKKKTLEQYMNVRKDIFHIGDDDRGHEAFIHSIRNTIEPLYQIANNQGYGIWSGSYRSKS